MMYSSSSGRIVQFPDMHTVREVREVREVHLPIRLRIHLPIRLRIHLPICLRIIRLLALSLIVLLPSTDVSAQQNFQWRNFTRFIHGLSGNNVRFITEDARGQIWLATSTGLGRFDGFWHEIDVGGEGQNINDISRVLITNALTDRSEDRMGGRTPNAWSRERPQNYLGSNKCWSVSRHRRLEGWWPN